LVSFVNVANAQTQNKIERLEQLQAKEKLEGALNELESLIENQAREVENSCIKAFGDKIFCNCISVKLPSILSFPEYVAIVSLTKNELNYQNLSKKDKEIIDIARLARDTCVNLKDNSLD
jgi:hypothetical protein